MLSDISVIFETVPPNAGTSQEKVDERVRELLSVKDYVHGYIIPDLTKEDILHLRREKMDVRKYAACIREVTQQAIFLNKITVFTPLNELIPWVVGALNSVDYITLVGRPRGYSVENLTGSSVEEAGRYLRERNIPYGCILIPAREEEVARVLEKSPVYMVTQIQLSPERLIEFMKKYRAKEKNPAKIFVSLNPFSSEKELEALENLGVEVPNDIGMLPDNTIRIQEASIRRAKEVAERILEVSSYLGLPVGFNIGHIHRNTLYPAMELAMQLYEEFR